MINPTIDDVRQACRAASENPGDRELQKSARKIQQAYDMAQAESGCYKSFPISIDGDTVTVDGVVRDSEWRRVAVRCHDGAAKSLMVFRLLDLPENCIAQKDWYLVFRESSRMLAPATVPEGDTIDWRFVAHKSGWAVGNSWKTTITLWWEPKGNS